MPYPSPADPEPPRTMWRGVLALAGLGLVCLLPELVFLAVGLIAFVR